MPNFFQRLLPAGCSVLLCGWLTCTAQQTSATAPAPAAASQQTDQPGDSAQSRQQRQRLGQMAKSLNLSDDQKRQWMQIQRSTTQKVQAVRRDDSLSEEQMQQKLKDIHKGQREQLIALLSPEQQDSLKKWWEEQRQKQQDKNPGGNAADKSGDKNKDDDFFAGMVEDPDASAPSGQNKKAPPKN